MNQKLLAAEHPHVQGEFERLRHLVKVQEVALTMATDVIGSLTEPDAPVSLVSTHLAKATAFLAENGIVEDVTVITVLLAQLEPKELGALVDALDRLKPGISDEAWNLAAALDAEEARRVKAEQPVAYSDDETTQA